MIRPCEAPGCSTLTLGPCCIAHEEPVTRTFARGRPWTRPVSAAAPPPPQPAAADVPVPVLLTVG